MTQPTPDDVLRKILRETPYRIMWIDGRNVSDHDIARQLLELREAVRRWALAPPAGRRLGKQESMQLRHLEAREKLYRHLPEHAEKP